MPARDTLGEDVIARMRLEFELGAVAPRISRQRLVPPALFISDEEAVERPEGEDDEQVCR